MSSKVKRRKSKSVKKTRSKNKDAKDSVTTARTSSIRSVVVKGFLSETEDEEEEEGETTDAEEDESIFLSKVWKFFDFNTLLAVKNAACTSKAAEHRATSTIPEAKKKAFILYLRENGIISLIAKFIVMLRETGKDKRPPPEQALRFLLESLGFNMSKYNAAENMVACMDEMRLKIDELLEESRDLKMRLERYMPVCTDYEMSRTSQKNDPHASGDAQPSAVNMENLTEYFGSLKTTTQVSSTINESENVLKGCPRVPVEFDQQPRVSETSEANLHLPPRMIAEIRKPIKNFYADLPSCRDVC